jgi:hypothetical protein
MSFIPVFPFALVPMKLDYEREGTSSLRIFDLRRNDRASIFAIKASSTKVLLTNPPIKSQLNWKAVQSTAVAHDPGLTDTILQSAPAQFTSNRTQTMAPYTNIPLSPAELSYLQTSLSATPPIRPDGRSPTQFRPLVAEADILPSANGSARVCFSDGTEAIVGVKAEVEKSRLARQTEGEGEDVEMGEDINATGEGKGRNEWLEVAIDVPGLRDDDALPIFLGAMLSEALCADGGLRDRLWINKRFHWRLYVDVSYDVMDCCCCWILLIFYRFCFCRLHCPTLSLC